LRSWRLAVAAVFIGVAGPAAAQLVGENLVVTTPDGYKIASETRKNDLVLTQMVPAGESANDWSEMVTVQVFRGQKVDAKQFATTLAREWIKACPDGQAYAISETQESGYPVLLFALTCPRNDATGKPEYAWFKTITGNESFFLVQRTAKFAPSPEQLATWGRYLRSIAVCDSRLPERACPAAQP
jgi:hypothetical protein